MHALKVGDLYNPKRRRWPEGNNYNFRGGEHELLLLFQAPSADEVGAIASGEIELALFVEQPVICLLYRAGPDGGGIPWSDASFSIHRLPVAERAEPADEANAVFRVVLVDANTGIVKALRVVLLATGFTASLHAAIREQAALAHDERAFDRTLASLYDTFPEAAEMAAAASNRTTVPAKTSELREA